MVDRYIYHICRSEEWEKALQSGYYSGSSQDLDDGFIHFSTGGQLRESAAKHRSGQDGLVVLTVDIKRLGKALKWEPSRTGKLFPHLYGRISIEDVLKVSPLPLGTDGKHVFSMAFQKQ